MVSKQILEDLKSYGLPIIGVGDHGRLPPVGDDAELMKGPDVRLEQLHRNAGPIARFAEFLRKGGDAADWPATTWDDERKGGVMVRPKGAISVERMARADQVICAYNRTRAAVNDRIRAERWPDGFTRNAPPPGDRVICLFNGRGRFNGQQGVAADVRPATAGDAHGPEIRFIPDGVQVHADDGWVLTHPEFWGKGKYPKLSANRAGMEDIATRGVPFDFAYCLTAHKMQGDQADKIVVLEERCDLWEHARWAYTAASRAA
ncbi:MAG: hypothetical protein K2V38_09085, partial [Gemmataceae bacterium]|nr:hypothetical protein [Gemmataceae bacterium]